MQSNENFKAWLAASCQSTTGNAEPCIGDFSVGAAGSEGTLTSHPLYRRLLEAVLACQRAATVDTQGSADGDIAQEVLAFKRTDTDDVSEFANCELSTFLSNYCVVLEDIASQLTTAHDIINKICQKQQDNFLNLANPVSKDSRVVHAEESEPAIRMRYRSAIQELKSELVNKRKRGRLPAESTSVLTTWWTEHERWPYPTEAEKVILCASTGLNTVQLNNWFINRRKRQWSKSVEEL